MKFASDLVPLVTSQVIVPLLLLWWLVAPPRPEGQDGWSSRANWALHAVVAVAGVAFVLTVGAQSWTSVYVGAGLLGGLVGALWRSARELPDTWGPFRTGEAWGEKLLVGAQLLLGLVYIPLSAYAATGYTTGEEAVALRFPLEDGVYIVGQGGSTPLINYHNTSETQEYAVDLVKLTAWGTRAQGIYPDALDRYAIYGDTLHSPCDGRVETAVSRRPEYAPPARDEAHPAGNHVVLRCKGVRVHMAHLIPASVSVNPGDAVQTGAPLGRIGNSGNSSEPHLHIHATRAGEGVPLTFNGRFLVRNSLVWR